MKRKLGRLETQLLAYAHLRGWQTLRTGDLTGPLRLTAKQERELLSRLFRSGIIAQVRRGLYLVPEKLPLGGGWSPDMVLALNTLMQDQRGRCQICGPNAFNRYGWDEQIPARTYVYNNRLSGERIIGAIALTLIKVSDKRLGSTEQICTPEGRTALYSSRVRSLVDAVYDWARFNSLPRAYDWIRRELVAKRIKAAKLVRDTLRYGDIGKLIRRIGWVLEQEGISAGTSAKTGEGFAAFDWSNSIDSDAAKTWHNKPPLGSSRKCPCLSPKH